MRLTVDQVHAGSTPVLHPNLTDYTRYERFIMNNVGDGIKYRAILFRTTQGYKKLEKEGYGYIIDIAPRMIAIDNGIDIFWVDSNDIVENYGNKIVFAHRNVNN